MSDGMWEVSLMLTCWHSIHVGMFGSSREGQEHLDSLPVRRDGWHAAIVCPRCNRKRSVKFARVNLERDA